MYIEGAIEAGVRYWTQGERNGEVSPIQRLNFTIASSRPNFGTFLDYIKTTSSKVVVLVGDDADAWLSNPK